MIFLIEKTDASATEDACFLQRPSYKADSSVSLPFLLFLLFEVNEDDAVLSLPSIQLHLRLQASLEAGKLNVSLPFPPHRRIKRQ